MQHCLIDESEGFHFIGDRIFLDPVKKINAPPGGLRVALLALDHAPPGLCKCERGAARAAVLRGP